MKDPEKSHLHLLVSTNLEKVWSSIYLLACRELHHSFLVFYSGEVLNRLSLGQCQNPLQAKGGGWCAGGRGWGEGEEAKLGQYPDS